MQFAVVHGVDGSVIKSLAHETKNDEGNMATASNSETKCHKLSLRYASYVATPLKPSPFNRVPLAHRGLSDFGDIFPQLPVESRGVMFRFRNKFNLISN